ncbi:hypothetical protein DMP15_29140 [Pseudonocardia sp. UM4_GMWB1]|uniref:hypothetical protein n=1 Tax=Pseudonocardia sp. UM4_GMWB1 TaxID=2212989 RepID=UPI00307DA549
MSAPVTNGHRAHEPVTWSTSLDPVEPGARPEPSLDVVESTPADQVQALAREVEEARGLVELQDDPALQNALSRRERQLERRVSEQIRRARRKERRSTALAEVAGTRRERQESRWVERARASKDRLLDPNRRLAATYRRYLGLSAIPPTLIAFGVVFMSATTHDGVVGVDGPWWGYVLEPMASLLLVVSLIIGFTAVQNNRPIPRGLYILDAGLALASLFLVVVPWGLRYGFDLGSTFAHVLPSLLVVAAVVVQHLLHSVFRPIFAELYEELQPSRLSDQTSDTVVLYERTRRAIAADEIPLSAAGSPSREAIRKKFGVGKVRSQLAGDAYELVQRSIDPR